MSKQLITYSCGPIFDLKQWDPIKNRSHNKPDGGLWASPVNSNYGWREWCLENGWNIAGLDMSFTTVYDGNTLIIDTCDDLNKLIWQSTPYDFAHWPDFEKLLILGYDGIFITEAGEKATRFSHPGLYGWDCESLLIMNPDSLI